MESEVGDPRRSRIGRDEDVNPKDQTLGLSDMQWTSIG